MMQGWTEVLGPMPEHWKGSCTIPLVFGKATQDDMDHLYDPSTAARDDRSLAHMISRELAHSSGKERKLTQQVMEKIFQYEPEQRLTAAELLGDTSFKELMAIFGVDDSNSECDE